MKTLDEYIRNVDLRVLKLQQTCERAKAESRKTNEDIRTLNRSLRRFAIVSAVSIYLWAKAIRWDLLLPLLIRP